MRIQIPPQDVEGRFSESPIRKTSPDLLAFPAQLGEARKLRVCQPDLLRQSRALGRTVAGHSKPSRMFFAFISKRSNLFWQR